MACIVSLLCTNSSRGKVVRRGNPPTTPVTWKVKAWFVLPDGAKHTHSATVPQQTADSLVPVMLALIDGLVADHGNEIESAGWTATTHGKR